MRDDPRVTRVGAILRRYSLDELPQLFNVLGGHDVAGRAAAAAARARSPATTRRAAPAAGQAGPDRAVAGQRPQRPVLGAAVRLDLRYVENWTLALDAQILWKTFGAVVHSRGAY